MSLNDIPDCLLISILEYISDNKSSISLVSSCKYFKNLFYKNGYLKYLTTKPLGLNPYDFAMKTAEHSRTLKTISMYNTKDPQYWIFSWPKVAFFNHCHITKIDPTKPTQTEILYILNNPSTKLEINWFKFPNLKKLELTSWNFNYSEKDIRDKCKYLKHINIQKTV